MRIFGKSSVLGIIVATTLAFSGCTGDDNDSDQGPSETPQTSELPFTQAELEALTPLEYYLQSGYEPELATCLADVLARFDIASMVEFEDLSTTDPKAAQVDDEVDACLAANN